MGAFESKILDLLKEATAAGNYPADFSANVKQADVPQANSIDKQWPMEAEDVDDDMMVAEDEDDVVDDDTDDMDVDDDDDTYSDDDDMMGDDDDEEIMEDAADGDGDMDLDKTFSEMISRLKEAESDPDKPEGEIEESADDDEDDEKIVAEAKAKAVKESKRRAVKESKKKKVTEGEMPDFLKKKLDKDGDGEPDVKKEDVQPGEVGMTEPDAPEPTLKVTEADEKDEVSDDEKAIFGEANLPEDFRKKASVVFEAAIKARAAETRKRVTEEATKSLKEAYAVLKKKADSRQKAYEEKLSEGVDRYMTYISSQWLKENRLAVEAGIRAELAEDFISGLKKLFVEHYIEIPQSKVDVVKMMGKKLAKMESRLNEQTKTNVKLRESLTRYRRDEMVRATTNGLTAIQADKLKKLSEGITFQNREQFTSALNTLKESYFPKEKAKGTLTEEATKKPVKAEAEPIQEDMAIYIKTLSKNNQS